MIILLIIMNNISLKHKSYKIQIEVQKTQMKCLYFWKNWIEIQIRNENELFF